MKLTRLLFLSLVCPALAGAAEDLSIDWYTVAGGGGSTSAGEFSVSGTVGQPEAGMLMAYCCRLSLFGGYWSQFIDVNQPDGPRLCLHFTPTNTFLLSWPAYHADYLLQKKPAAVPGWSDITASPVVVEGENQVLLDDLFGYVTSVCTNFPSGEVVTNQGPWLTGFEWYLYYSSLGGIPPPNCWMPTFTTTNPSTLFRLRKQ